MNWSAYKKTLISWQALKELGVVLSQSFGVLAALLGVLDVLFPNTFNLKYNGLLTLGIISFIWAVWKIFPKFEITRTFALPSMLIKVKVGDLFKQEGNLLIGMSDTFDTEKGDIIKANSIQGQFLKHIYNDNTAQLNKDLDGALKNIPFNSDSEKRVGKTNRYDIGTVATIVLGSKKYFCLAYSSMGNDLKAQSDVWRITMSLEALWKEIRLKGQGEGISMGVIGSDLARVGEASYSNLVKLIISSFIFASREKYVASSLTIMIHENDLVKINMLDINSFLQNF